MLNLYHYHLDTVL